MNNKKTAVEWLVKEISRDRVGRAIITTFLKEFEQAKEMEDLKQQKYDEMVDFINRVSGEMLRNDFVLDEKWYEQARQLIKEAKEL